MTLSSATIINHCKPFFKIAVPLVFYLFSPIVAFAQVEFTTWGNLTGIRVDGELMQFNTSLFIADENWLETRETRKEAQKIGFNRLNENKIFTFEMDSLRLRQELQTLSRNKASIKTEVTALHDTLVAGVYMRIALPEAEYPKLSVRAIEPSSKPINPFYSGGDHIIMRTPARGLHIESQDRQLTIQLDKTTDIITKKVVLENDDDANPNSNPAAAAIYIRLADGNLKKGDQFKQQLTVEIDGIIDKEPVDVTLFPDLPGNRFKGIGGNFRLQNPETDPQVIHYTLNNMRVAEGRVQMLWNYWHRNENEQPYQKAKEGDIHPRVIESMKMAQKLEKMGMPVYVAIWFPPDWAIVPNSPAMENQISDNLMGNRLDTTKMNAIYESITSYLVFMKEEFGVTTEYFSFNESDLGIDVRQTAREHLQLIKELGRLFRKNGLKTKLLLGDNSDLTTLEFMLPTSKDPAARAFMGPVSFHSWRGYTEENLYRWYDMANRVNRPLIVGEGSIDAGAWRYPEIFQEEDYAREEINTYIKIMKIAQVRSILQWQLTADYSLMAGGGIFGNDEEPLYPTQRFFNLKQLAETPENLHYIPTKTDEATINVTALIDDKKQSGAIHIVNNGARRTVTISPIPEYINQFTHYVTNDSSDMRKLEQVVVLENQINVVMEPDSFITLISN